MIPKAPGFDRRKDLYLLYHYLNHTNLFGGGVLMTVYETVLALFRLRIGLQASQQLVAVTACELLSHSKPTLMQCTLAMQQQQSCWSLHTRGLTQCRSRVTVCCTVHCIRVERELIPCWNLSTFLHVVAAAAGGYYNTSLRIMERLVDQI